MNQKKAKIVWKTIDKSEKEDIQIKLKELLKKIKRIDMNTFPKGILEKINSFNDYKNKYDDLLLINMQLLNSLEESKQGRIMDANIFKAKAMTFGDKAQSEIKKIKDKLHQKSEKDIKEIHKYKAADLLEGILVPINNIKNALRHGKQQNSKELKNYLIGFEMLIDQLELKLSDEGLTLIEPKIGDSFDPVFHTALSVIDNGKKFKDKIISIKEHGYILHDRVLIPANVIIGK